MFKDFSWTEVWDELKISSINVVSTLIYIAIVFLLASLVLRVISKYTAKGLRDAQKIEDKQRSKDLATTMTLARSISRYVIYLIAIFVVANHLGLGTVFGNVITAAGIGTLAISFGAQSIVQDVVTGLFLIFEKQYGVGDYVKINDFSGTVSAIAVRCTYLKSWTGEKIIIPNGKVSTVINYSQDFNMAVIEVPVGYDQDTGKIMKIMQEVCDKYYDEHEAICYDKPSVRGITAYKDSSVSVTVYFKAKGRNHYTIQNDLRYLIKERFDQEGISIPFNQLVIHDGGRDHD